MHGLLIARGGRTTQGTRQMQNSELGVRNVGERSAVRFRAAGGADSRESISRWENTVLPNEPNSSQRPGGHGVTAHLTKHGVVIGSSRVEDWVVGWHRNTDYWLLSRPVACAPGSDGPLPDGRGSDSSIRDSKSEIRNPRSAIPDHPAVSMAETSGTSPPRLRISSAMAERVGSRR